MHSFKHKSLLHIPVENLQVILNAETNGDGMHLKSINTRKYARMQFKETVVHKVLQLDIFVLVSTCW